MYLKHQIPRLTIPGKTAFKKKKKKKTGIHIYKPGILRGINETDTWGLPTASFSQLPLEYFLLKLTPPPTNPVNEARAIYR